jgi:hypothetical protein
MRAVSLGNFERYFTQGKHLCDFGCSANNFVLLGTRKMTDGYPRNGLKEYTDKHK